MSPRKLRASITHLELGPALIFSNLIHLELKVLSLCKFIVDSNNKNSLPRKSKIRPAWLNQFWLKMTSDNFHSFRVSCTSSFMLVKPWIISNSNEPPTGHLDVPAVSSRPSCISSATMQPPSPPPKTPRGVLVNTMVRCSLDDKRSCKRTCLSYLSSIKCIQKPEGRNLQHSQADLYL